MADEITPNPQSEDTSAIEAAPQEGTPAAGESTEQETTDWQKRYSDLHPEYTRATQALSQREQEAAAWQALATSDDPEYRQQAADFLGVQLEEDDEDTPDEFEDPTAKELALTRKELQELKEWRQEQEAAAQVAQMRGLTDQLAEQAGVALTDRQRTLILSEATEAGFDPRTGSVSPDAIKQAFDAWQKDIESIVTERQKQAGRRPKAPHVTKGGQSAEQVPNLDNRDELIDYVRDMASQIEIDNS